MNNEKFELFVFNPGKKEDLLAFRLYLLIRKSGYAKASFLKRALGCSDEELFGAFQWLFDAGKLQAVPAPDIDPLNENFSRS